MLHLIYSMTKHINKLFYSWFYIGYSPKAPGTMASLGAIPLCIMLNQFPGHIHKVGFILAFILLAILSATFDQETSLIKDPSYFVIDEVVGMLIATYFVMKNFTFEITHIVQYLSAFIFFRLFDIWKPFPISFLDKKSKTSNTAFKRGAFIVLDDVLAGVFACALFYFSMKLFWIYLRHSSN